MKRRCREFCLFCLRLVDADFLLSGFAGGYSQDIGPFLAMSNEFVFLSDIDHLWRYNYGSG